MKIKLRDLTKEQYEKWLKVNCGNCSTCPFFEVYCTKYNCWIKHKELYSDKFLDQEIEVEDEISEEARIFLEDKMIPLGSAFLRRCGGGGVIFYTDTYKEICLILRDEINKMFNSLEIDGKSYDIKELVVREDDILTLEERVYLRKIIEPYRDKVRTIEKVGSEYFDSDNDFIVIHLVEDSISLPILNTGFKFNGMELNKQYTVKELRL